MINLFKIVNFSTVVLLAGITVSNGSDKFIDNDMFSKSLNNKILNFKDTSEESKETEDVDLSKIILEPVLTTGLFKIKGKDYSIDIDETLLKSKTPYTVKDEFKDMVIETLIKLQDKNPSNRVVGYSLGLRTGKITFSAFLGENAK
jgi:hypothetical protein